MQKIKKYKREDQDRLLSKTGIPIVYADNTSLPFPT